MYTCESIQDVLNCQKERTVADLNHFCCKGRMHLRLSSKVLKPCKESLDCYENYNLFNTIQRVLLYGCTSINWMQIWRKVTGIIVNPSLAFTAEIAATMLQHCAKDVIKYQKSESVFFWSLQPNHSCLSRFFPLLVGCREVSSAGDFSCLSICHRQTDDPSDPVCDSSGSSVMVPLPIQSLCGQPPPPDRPPVECCAWYSPRARRLRAAAGWNMIGPLSKHAFHYGCVLSCTDSGNTSDWEKSSVHSNIFHFGWFITSDYINLRATYSWSLLLLLIMIHLSSLKCQSLGSQCSLLLQSPFLCLYFY